mmetsp:Transcript_47745/g.111345  ORF Transcript_47745/g.111345 Transcript_47745/m.111345 type:complete len:226 (+) Transcript_47745:1915-2592(+)
MLLCRLLRGRIHRDQDLLCAPVELHVMVALKREHHRCDRWLLPLAHEVKIEHTLHCTVLQPIDNCLCARCGCYNCLLVACWRRLWGIGLLGTLHWNHCVGGRRSWCSEIGLWQWVNDSQGHRYHCCDVSLGTIELDAKTQLVAGSFHLPQALQVVRSGASDPNLDVVLLDVRSILIQGLDEACECCRHICEIGNATTNDEEFAFRMLVAEHQAQNGLGVVEGLFG